MARCVLDGADLHLHALVALWHQVRERGAEKEGKIWCVRDKGGEARKNQGPGRGDTVSNDHFCDYATGLI